MATELEIKNASKVIEMLSKLEESFSFEQTHEDLFTIHEGETGLDVIVDVEETTIVFFMNICDLPAEATEGSLMELYGKLLKINNEAPHGAFCISDNRILFKDTLEVENLDQNELEATVHMMILTIYQHLETIEKLVA